MGIVYLLLFILMNICRYISNAHFSKPCLGICSEIQACKNWVNLNPNLSELWGTQVHKIDKPNKSKKANTASNGGEKIVHVLICRIVLVVLEPSDLAELSLILLITKIQL